MKKVLVVEDSQAILKAWGFVQILFKPELQVLTAETLLEARAHFEANPDVDIIVMDGGLSVAGDTIPLVQEIRQTYSGPIVAASGNEESQELLMQSGCDIECPSKELSAHIALKLIGFNYGRP